MGTILNPASIGVLSAEIPLIAYNGTDYSHTGDTALTTIASLTVEGGLMGPNDMLEIDHLWTFEGGAGTRSCLIYADASALFNKSGQASTRDACQSKTFFRNHSSTGAQRIMHSTINTVYEFTGTVYLDYTVDTTADFVLTFKCQLGSAADLIELTGVSVKYVPAVGSFD